MGLAVGAWRFSPAPRGYVHFNRDKSTNREHSKQGEYWAAPLMAGQMPVVVVPGGEFAVGGSLTLTFV